MLICLQKIIILLQVIYKCNVPLLLPSSLKCPAKNAAANVLFFLVFLFSRLRWLNSFITIHFLSFFFFLLCFCFLVKSLAYSEKKIQMIATGRPLEAARVASSGHFTSALHPSECAAVCPITRFFPHIGKCSFASSAFCRENSASNCWGWWMGFICFLSE